MEIDLDKLLETGAHFGHQLRRWNPKMEPYMYAVKDGIYVFDLIKTKDLLLKSLEVLKEASQKNKVILLVGTKKQVKDKVEEVGKAVSIPYVSERWLGGTLTNFNQIKKSIQTLSELEEKLKTAQKEGYTKKERLLLQRKIEKMHISFGGILGLEDKPDLMVIIDTHREKSAVNEAIKTGVKIVGVVDSNADPDQVTWPIPLNDDSAKTLEYVLDLFKEAILEGKKKVKSKK